MKVARFFCMFVFAAFSLFVIPGQAQQSPQILRHHLRSAVSNGQTPLLGSLPSEQRMNLSIVLPLRNQSELTNLLSRLYDPTNPDYRHFLSVEQFTAQFGPTAEDYQTVVDFAQANGFTVTDRPANRSIVPINGSVAQIDKAFNVRMNNYRNPTEDRTFYSPDREPSLALSVPVAHIAGLNNFSIPRPMVMKASEAQGIVNAAVAGSGPGGSYLASDMRAAYYTSTLLSGGAALTGSGQAVGLVEFDGYQISDVTSSFAGTATSSANGSNYMLSYTPTAGGTTYGIPVNNVLLDGATGASVSGNDAEEVLDIVQAIGMAPGLSQVRVYIGNSDVDVLNAMAAENIAKQLSISWEWSPDDPSTDDFIFQEMAAQGQSIFAASGDDGAYASRGFEVAEANFYPSEDAWLSSVGGTDLVTNGAGGSWNSETAWDQSGGGISPDGIPIPSWQAGVANDSNGGSTTVRNVPDVAAEADFDNYDCNMGAYLETYAGTSFAAPRWAGFMALVNQQAVDAGNSTVGFVNPAIYTIGEGSSYSSDFHDITSGNNDCCNQGVSFNSVVGYDLVTGWGSPTGQDLIDALAPPASLSLQLSASPTSLTINPGTSGTTTITLQNVGGFSGNVTLSVSGLPSDVTGSFSNNPAIASSVLTLTVGNSAVHGSYLLTIIGVSGTMTATTSLALEVNAPGFSISAPSGPIQISAGVSVSSWFYVTDYGGFANPVSVAVTSALPSGVTASWVSNPSTTCSLLTLTASDTATPDQTFVVTISGISGNETETTTIAVTTFQALYYVAVSPIPSTIAQGNSVVATVTLVPVGDITIASAGTVTLATYDLPSGVTATFSQNPITTGTSVLTINASGSTVLGTSEVYVGANGTALSTELAFPLTITALPTSTYTVSSASPSLNITQGGNVTDVITVTRLNGFPDSVNLSVYGLPSGVSASFGTNPTTGTSVMALTADSSATPGFYWCTVAGISGTQTIYGYFYLTVGFPPSFTFSSSPTSLTVAQGASASGNITIAPQAGFTGSVTLSVPNLPNGLTPSFSANPTTGSSLLTLTANCSISPGNYLAIVTGHSDPLHANTAPLAVTVTSSASCIVIPTVTTLSILPSGGTLTVGESYNLSATVTPTNGSVTPTGNVILTIGSVTQTVALNSFGVATYIGTAPTAAGGLTLSAAYQGSTEFSASTSNTLNETVVIPTFSITGTSVSVAPGATTGNTSTITLTPSGGFTGSVALTSAITSSPAGAVDLPTLSFSTTTPVNITGTAAATAILTISTVAPTSGCSATLLRQSGVPWSTASSTLACLLLFGIPAQRRSWRTMIGMVALLVVLTGGVLACGGGSGSACSVNNTPGTTAGAYTITVTGTVGTTTVTGPIVLNVQ